VDVVGYYGDVPRVGAAFVPLTPSRVFDSRRDGQGSIDNGIDYQTALGTWAGSMTQELAMNITAVNGRASGFLTIYPEPGSLPSTSNLNWTAGQTVANSAIESANLSGGWISIYSGGTGTGGVGVILDVYGFFQSDLV
jgi:hypothetical protein